MKWLVFAGFFIGLVRAGNADDELKQPSQIAADVEAECLAGSEWESNCHTCRCSSDGVADCTRMKVCSLENRDLEPIRCKPNSTFHRSCNTCVCLDNGLSLCTLVFCANANSNFARRKSNLVKGKDCANGTKWKSRCNNCFCSDNGLPACTDQACPGEDSEPELQCEPDSSWKNDCNTCWCSPDGRAMCTKMGCGVLINNTNFEESEEKSSLAFKSSQNKTVVCLANRMFIKDCNTCWCNEDGTGYFCTRKVCVQELPDEVAPEEKPEELRVILKECRPDEVFELDCNMCRCNPDGKSYSCTRRACSSEIEPPIDASQFDFKKNPGNRKRRGIPPQETLKNCQPGQQFRMDCNTCLCDNIGQDFSCTRMDCKQPTSSSSSSRKKREVGTPAITQCSPGTVFEHGCNVCRCTADGRHATCALKRCPAKPLGKDEYEKEEPESDPNFRCDPGEQSKRGCNDCTCSADGKSIFCTLRLCEKDILPNF